MKRYPFLILLFLGLTSSCVEKSTLFMKVSPQKSGVGFVNQITESLKMNIIDEENIYNGGGVGIGDFNNDGLMDLYFSGNMVGNKLYLNKGELSFEDITEVSGTQAIDRWSRGVAVVDINHDGWEDIYVSCTILDEAEKRENLLFINQGLTDGIPVFKELAEAYGLNSDKHTTQASFLDYDQDGDLDVFLANNVFAQRDNPNNFRKRFVQGEHPSTDQLFRCEFDSTLGHPVFSDVSKEAGIQQEGYSHSVISCDINRDGWTDIFVANDYLSEDLFYINNQDGTFSNRSRDLLKHTSFNSMGADVIDLNNDGLDDIVELDMNPEDNFRKKTMLGGARYEAYQLNLIYDYQFQYIRNMLHLNQGGMTINEGMPRFSDIGFLAGIAETDWSWTPLVGDFDLDGNRDMIITNGFPKDVTDHDFMAYRNSAFGMNDKAKLLSLIPEVKIPNYAYRNMGGAKFTDVTEQWGLEEPSFSNGAVVADLDNDGDLEVIINNINAPATIYRNNTRETTSTNYLTISLTGKKSNPTALGARVALKSGNRFLSNYSQNVRGYLSSNDSRLHFGLGASEQVDSLFIEWPGGYADTLTNISANQLLQLDDPQKIKEGTPSFEPLFTPLLAEVSEELNFTYSHKANELNDYSIQRTLPHKYSQLGPGIATADMNGDNLVDVIINQHDSIIPDIYLQKSSGFELMAINLPELPKGLGKASTLEVLDIENDGDKDIVIGFCEFENTLNKEYPALLFLINQGEATFYPEFLNLKEHINVSVIKSSDLDGDGLKELFVGCHARMGRYPEAGSSYLLKNESQSNKILFKDLTDSFAPSLQDIGIINDAEWRDIDSDNDNDLILGGDYLPITILENSSGRLREMKSLTPNGWWKSIELEDIDKDGDLDILAGNYGQNSSFTVRRAGKLINYFQDHDRNGVIETLLTREYKNQNGERERFLASSRDEVIALFPEVKKRHLEYASFAGSSLDDLFEEETLNRFDRKVAEEFRSGVLLNQGESGFEFIPFPMLAQTAPIFDFGFIDLDLDGRKDVLIAGNYFGTEVFNGRLDAMNGLALSNQGDGVFEPIPLDKSGFLLEADAKDLACLNRPSDTLILASQHNGPLKIFRPMAE